MRSISRTLVAASVFAMSCRQTLPRPTMPLVRTPDAAFRAHAPPPLEPRAIAWPTIERFTLENGMTVIRIPKDGTPVASIRFVCRRCGDDDPRLPAGIATLAARWLSGSSLGVADLSRVGHGLTRLETDVDHDAASLVARVDPGTEFAAITRLAERVRDRSFDREHFERVRAAMVQHRIEEYTGVDGELAASSIWGESHPYGRPITGFATAIQQITYDEAREYVRTHYVPSESALVVAGTIARDQLERVTRDAFGSWRAEVSLERPPLPAAHPAAHPVFVDTPRSLSAEILVAMPGVSAGSDQYTSMLVLDAILGGLFSSRTNTVLREERGYTYGSRSDTVSYREGGSLVVKASVPADRAIEAIRQLYTEFDRLRAAPPSNDELTAARETWRARLGASFERADGATELVTEWFVHDRPLDLREAIVAIQRVDAASVHRTAQSLLARDRTRVVVLADRERLGGSFRRAFGETQFLVFR